MDYSKFPEAECLLNYSTERMKRKKGIIMLFTGESGNGKSYASLRFLELWYKKWFNEKFPFAHICNTLPDAILLVKDFKRIGEGIMIEELSVHIGVRESLTTSNVLFNKFIDICRIKQAVIIGNCPHISFIDKHFQMMCQVWVECGIVSFKEKVVIAHPLWLQTSPHKKEPYKHKFLNSNGDEINECFFNLPSKDAIEFYDESKNKSNDNLFDEVVLKLRADKLKQLKKLGQKVLSKREKEAYTLWINGEVPKESAKKMGIKYVTTYNGYVQRAKRKLNQPEYSEYAKEVKEWKKRN